VFWFLVAGLPGAAVYRFANTADAMWGYRGTRGGRCWEWAGKWAARADDLLSWLPARLTAVLIAAVTRSTAWRRLRDEAGRTPSPNSGWPMAAMALALDARLAKPGVYTLNAGGAAPGSVDVARAVRVARDAVALLLAAACLSLLLATWIA
jgi:adenosylcobinamide-phosphate synthase